MRGVVTVSDVVTRLTRLEKSITELRAQSYKVKSEAETTYQYVQYLRSQCSAILPRVTALILNIEAKLEEFDTNIGKLQKELSDRSITLATRVSDLNEHIRILLQRSSRLRRRTDRIKQKLIKAGYYVTF